MRGATLADQKTSRPERPCVPSTTTSAPMRPAAPRTGAELAKGLRVTWEMIAGCLGHWTPDDLDEVFTTHRGAQRTRQWIVWHVIEHDLHHGGELFFTLGMNGLPTPDL